MVTYSDTTSESDILSQEVQDILVNPLPVQDQCTREYPDYP